VQTNKRAVRRIDHTGKFRQQPIPGSLNDTALVVVDLRIDEGLALDFLVGDRSAFIVAHQPTVIDHIDRQDCR
jgi:hypothetical protein